MKTPILPLISASILNLLWFETGIVNIPDGNSATVLLQKNYALTEWADTNFQYNKTSTTLCNVC